MNHKTPWMIFTLGGLLVVAVFLGISCGSVPLSLTQLLSEEYRPILGLRLWRVLMALVAGSGLAVSGIALQAILRNPLERASEPLSPSFSARPAYFFP
jgi:iron complex transport system permease protein